jgi:hypothetical protein
MLQSLVSVKISTQNLNEMVHTWLFFLLGGFFAGVAMVPDFLLVFFGGVVRFFDFGAMIFGS